MPEKKEVQKRNLFDNRKETQKESAQPSLFDPEKRICKRTGHSKIKGEEKKIIRIAPKLSSAWNVFGFVRHQGKAKRKKRKTVKNSSQNSFISQYSQFHR